MGACASCLGRDRDSEEDENDRLLYDDPHANSYGSFADNSMAPQADPEDVQRENEALQKIVNQTSNELVDIFAPALQNIQQSPVAHFNSQQGQSSQYQEVVSKISNENLRTDFSAADSDGPDDEDWDSEEEDNKPAKLTKPDIGPLVGGFADLERNGRS